MARCRVPGPHAPCPPPGLKGSCPGPARFPPQPGSPAVPGEGAEEPDARSQGGPHLAGWCPRKAATWIGGEREAVRPGRQQPGLNAPPAGPPRSRPLAPDRPWGQVQRKPTACPPRACHHRALAGFVSGWGPAVPGASASRSPVTPRNRKTDPTLLRLLDDLSVAAVPAVPSCPEKWWHGHRRETDARTLEG